MAKERKYVKDDGLNCPSPEAVNCVNRQPIDFNPEDVIDRELDGSCESCLGPDETMRRLNELLTHGSFNGKSFEALCFDIIKLHRRKNADYGGAFYYTMGKFGIISLLIRLDDKLSRLISVVKNGRNEVTDESIEDTLKDLASYAIMGLEHLYNTPQP